MTSKYILMSTSLFSSRRHWAALLRRGISTFLNTVHAQYSNFYLIEFNCLCGENIRLSLLVEENKAGTLISQTDRFFKRFFLDAGFAQSELHLPVEGIFIPFPQNTIQYGLYEPYRIENIHEINNYGIRLSLSKSLIEAFEVEEDIDEEAILTLAIYLHLALIKAILRNDRGSIADILDFYDGLRRKEDFLFKEDYLIPKFEDNAALLLEIVETMFTPSLTDSPPSWADKWSTGCENEFQSGTTWNAITNTISRHLGINGELQLVLLFLIKQILVKGSDNFKYYYVVCKTFG